MESHSGNSSDTKTLEAAASRMQAFCKALSLAPDMLYVGDSAMRHYYDTILLNDCTAFVSGQVTDTALKSIQQFLEQLPRKIVPEPTQYELYYLPKKVVDTQVQGV